MAEVIDENRVKYLINILQQQRNNAQNNLVDSLVEQQVLKEEVAQLHATVFKLQQDIIELREMISDSETRKDAAKEIGM